MKPRRRKCKTCRDWFEPKAQIQPVCGKDECFTAYAKELADKQRRKTEVKLKREQTAAKKAYKAETKRRKEKVLTRTELYQKLQSLVNQWVVHVRDKDKPCFTCGTTKTDIKYDAGHCFPVGSNKDSRFILTNIHKQCSVNCNQYSGGMRSVYEPKIIDTYGKDEYDRIKKPSQTLKEQFPTTQDIHDEIDRYRNLIRKAGLKPRR